MIHLGFVYNYISFKRANYISVCSKMFFSYIFIFTVATLVNMMLRKSVYRKILPIFQALNTFLPRIIIVSNAKFDDVLFA